MKNYSDFDLNVLITAGKEATIELSLIKSKKQTPRMKELLSFRRSRLNLIRKRARELSLTETDLENIHYYVHEKSLS
jgi:hypothetical protein